MSSVCYGDGLSRENIFCLEFASKAITIFMCVCTCLVLCFSGWYSALLSDFQVESLKRVLNEHFLSALKCKMGARLLGVKNLVSVVESMDCLFLKTLGVMHFC